MHAHGRLQTLDPEAAARVHPNDRRRVVRALELAEAGETLAGDDLWSGESRHPTLIFGLDVPDEVLEQRIRARAGSMLDRGVVDEARAALARPLSRSASKVMGLADFARASRRRGARGARREQPASRALPAEVDAPHAGSRPARRRTRGRRRRSRDRGDRASPWNAGAVITRIVERDWQRLRDVRLRALAQDPAAFIETYENASAFPDDRWRERATPSGRRRPSATKTTAGSTGSSAASSPTIRRPCFSSRCGWRPSFAAPALARELVESVLAMGARAAAPRVCASRSRATIRRAARLYEKCGFVETSDPPPFPYEPRPGSRFYVYEL